MINKFKLLQLTADFLINTRMSYYAVASGRKIGIFETWPACEEQVKGCKNAKYKKFQLKSEAEDFLRSHAANISGNASVPKPTILSKSDKTTASTIPENKDFWPSEDECDPEDDDFLLSALEEISPSNKRKAPETMTSLIKRQRDCEVIGVQAFGAFEFPIDSEGYIVVYTDGSCEGNGQSKPVAGFGVYFGENHPLNSAQPVTGRVTNNAGEIQAAICAIKIANNLKISKLCILTDSKLVVNAATSWMKAWKEKGWKRLGGGPVKNVDDFKLLDKLISERDIDIKWVYVKGHDGIKGNEKADQLARQGAQMYREQHYRKKYK